MHVHVVCVLHRREPHGVLALLTHHMQDHSHQQESVVGEGSVAGYREEGVRERGSEAMFAIKNASFSFHFGVQNNIFLNAVQNGYV